MTSFDAIVAGGGHNGLVAAAVLARGGRRVLLLEAAPELGGAARTEPFAPGFLVSAVAHLVNRLHPEVVRVLDLPRHGLALDGEGAPSVALSPEGDPLILHGAYGETVTGASAAEAAAWAALRAQLLRYVAILKPFLVRPAPRLDRPALADGVPVALAGLALRRLGREDMRDFLRMLLMNVTDVLDEHLADPRLRGLLAFDAVLGSHLGPRSPTSLLGLYDRLAGAAGGESGAQFVPRGGMGAVTAAMARSAAAAGVTARTEAEVARILVERGRVTGVALRSGEEVHAPLVLSALNPRTTLLELVGARSLDTGLVRKVSNVRMKGNVAKLHLALDRLPAFRGVPAEAMTGRLVIAPSDEAVETAFNPAKYGEMSDSPVIEVVIPTLTDPALAPEGRHVLSAVVQYAPYALKQGWDSGRPRLMDAVMRQLEQYAPGLGRSVLHAELLTPADIETRYRMPGGHWHHGELQPDQMLVSRPASGLSGYRTPIEGLWLCGAGSHPGGGVSGLPGLNAARAAEAGKR